MFEILISRKDTGTLKEKGKDWPAIYCLWYVRRGIRKRQYIGETTILCNRLKKHDKQWSAWVWTHFSFTPAPASERLRREQEAREIRRYNPPYNVQETER